MNHNIVLDTSFILNQPTGMGSFLMTCMNAMDSSNIEYNTVNLNLPNYYKFKFIFHFLWQNTVLLFKTFQHKYNVLFFPVFIMPFFTRKKTKYISAILDLCYLRESEMKPYYRIIYNFSTLISLIKADIIVTISETIKYEIVNYYHINENKIKVVYCSLTNNFITNYQKSINISNKYNIEPQKYILSVATLNKRKNIPELIKAFESISDKYPDIKLVLVGGMGNEQREKLTNHKNIIFTGYIPDEDIPALYKNALLYMYPSLYEGFGIPLIEAQYCECPVLCSDIPIFREIAENSVEFCDPQADCIAEKLEFLINNFSRREELIKLGRKNIKRFSIEKIAAQLKEVLY